MSNQDDTGFGPWVDTLQSRMRFGKFVSVGVVGAVFDMMTLLVLVEAFGVLEEVATVAGIEIAILVMFVLNERWTYSTAGRDGILPILRRLGRSHVVRAAGATVQFLVFVAIYRRLFVESSLAGIDMWLLVSKVGAIALAGIVNYVFETLFTWRVQAADGEEHQ